ncbi:MAG: hypothetical protein COB93_06725 [Sneathiella sp.]|nr:MAG: hypothetical protein COB93_06725 [Sneathiella sp.]
MAYYNTASHASRPGQRLLLLTALTFIVATVPGGLQIALDAMSEAYIAVAVFFAGTLMFVISAERSFKADLGDGLDRHRSLCKYPCLLYWGWGHCHLNSP